MKGQPVEEQLQFFFTSATRSDWKKIAMQETSGKDPFEALSWPGKDNIVFAPYYDHNDTPDVQHLRSQDTPAATVTQPRDWLNIPTVDMSDLGSANASVIDHIANGAHGLWIDTRKTPGITLEPIVTQISSTDTSLFLALGNNSKIIENLSEHLQDLVQVRTALFWESIPKTSNALDLLNRCKTLKSHGLLINSTSPVDEIATALTVGVHMHEMLQQASHPATLASICFSIAADVSFLETISKLRALRMLWCQVARAYGLNDYMPEHLHLHIRSESVSDGLYAPRENILKATFATVAAVLGGCNSLTVFGEIESPSFRRWSRNLSHIFREESFLANVTDPLEGSYAVEAMTDALAREAWKLFQSNMQHQ